MAQISRIGAYLLLSCNDKFATLHLDKNNHEVEQLLQESISAIKAPTAAAGSASSNKTTSAKDATQSGDFAKKPTDPAAVATPAAATAAPRVITASAVSPDGLHVCVCDSKKTLSVWKKVAEESRFTLFASHNLGTRCDHLAFTPKADAILAADKSGDVIKVSLEKGNQGNDDVTEAASADQECLLGHLSMLLAIQLSPCGRYVLTADRDEKIRVSHYPNSYNIHGFCLGHTEFVSCMKIHPENPEVIVSGSGDGTIRTWNYLQGQEIDRKVCGEDAGVKMTADQEEDESAPGGGENGSKKSGEDSKLKRAKVPGVRSIKCFQNKVAVHIENLNGLLLYDCTGDGQLQFRFRIDLKDPVIDFEFVTEKELLVLQASATAGDDKLPVTVIDVTGSGAVVVQENNFKPLNLVASFFSGIDSLNSLKLAQNLDGYYKRWFDNVNAYQENKEKRMTADKRTTNATPSDGKDSGNGQTSPKRLCKEISS